MKMFNFWCTYRQIELIIKKKKVKNCISNDAFPFTAHRKASRACIWQSAGRCPEGLAFEKLRNYRGAPLCSLLPAQTKAAVISGIIWALTAGDSPWDQCGEGRYKNKPEGASAASREPVEVCTYPGINADRQRWISGRTVLGEGNEKMRHLLACLNWLMYLYRM